MYNSIDEAVKAKQRLVEDLQAIEAQLTKRKAEVRPEEATDEEFTAYLDWRKRACAAKRYTTVKLQRTKAWIQQERVRLSDERVANRNGSDGLLANLHSLTKKLLSTTGACISSEEQTLMDDVRHYLN